MAANLILLPEAEQDLTEAHDWYEMRRSGLGEDFLSCVDSCFQAIRRNPYLHAVVHEEYRRALIRRFPYSVFYEYNKDSVIVYCVFHNARSPQKWRQRLP